MTTFIGPLTRLTQLSDCGISPLEPDAWQERA